MRRTLFDTPVITPFMYAVSRLFLRIMGWRPGGELPDIPKFVLIGAPHTSNWDFVYCMALAFIYKCRLFWMGKDSLFRPPFGFFFRWMGGIPIDRSKPHGVVAQTIETSNSADRLILCIPPEGTRKTVKTWKNGFYRIAHGAGVPIVMGFLDFKKRCGGFGPTLIATGDIEADMRELRLNDDQRRWLALKAKGLSRRLLRERSPKKIIRSRHSDFMLRMYRSIWAFRFGLFGGRRTAFVSEPSSTPRSARKLMSRSTSTYRLSRRNPS